MAQSLSGQIELTIPTIAEIQIPVPPLEIQTKIVEEIVKLENNKSHLYKRGNINEKF